MVFKQRINWKEQLPFIKERGLEGWTLRQLAENFGVTHQRVQQIVKKYIPDWYENYGLAIARKEHAQKYFDKWGKKDTTDLYSAQRAKFRQKRANSYGWEWTVTFGELDWPEKCPILGIPIDYFAESRMEGSPSFDRIDNNKGYVIGNVQIISWRANRIKNDGTADEHKAIAEYLYSLSNDTLANKPTDGI